MPFSSDKDMELESARLKLIEITWNDLESIHILNSIPEVDEFNTLGLPESLDETREIIRPFVEARNEQPRKSFSWKIIVKQNQAREHSKRILKHGNSGDLF